MRRKRDENEIFEAALTHFAKNGYKKTTLDDIARDLNMTNANLYSYFASKSDLYVACVSYALNDWQIKLFKSVKDIGGPREQLISLCDNGIKLLRDDKRLASLLREDKGIMPTFSSNTKYKLADNKSFITVKHILTMGIKSGEFAPLDVERTARVLFDIYKGLAISYSVSEPNDVEFKQNYDAIMNIVQLGILVRN